MEFSGKMTPLFRKTPKSRRKTSVQKDHLCSDWPYVQEDSIRSIKILTRLFKKGDSGDT